MKLAPYPEYKDAGVNWIGHIPAHWDERRAKYSFKEIDERSQTGEEEMLSVSHITGVTPRSQKNVTMFKAESNIGQKFCQPGDLVINTMWAWMAALGVSRHAGIVSPAYGVYRPKDSESYDHHYLDHLLRVEGYRTEYICRSTGVRSSRLRLYPDKFLSMRVICPPIEEQKAISRFLRYQEFLFRKFILNRRHLGASLAERREAVTLEALQLDGTQNLRLDVVAKKMERQINRRDDEIYTPVGLYNRGRGMFHKEPTKGSELGDSTFFWIKEGDLVLSGQFAWEGAIALANQEDTDCVASHRYPILRGKPSVAESAYLLSFFRTGIGHLLLDHHSRGSAGRNRPLNARTLMKEKIPIPPLNVQQEIADIVYLEQKLTRTVASQIAALHEYRTRLVADVVTGKLDVREAAAALPEIDPLADEDALGDTLDADAGADLDGELTEAQA